MHRNRPEPKTQVVVSSACLFVLLVAGCQRGMPGVSGADDPTPVNVSTMRLQREVNSGETAIFFGALKPIRETQLRFGKSGAIATIKPLGSRVLAGEQLATLEQSDLATQIADLETQVQASAATGPNLNLERQLKEAQAQFQLGIIEAPWDCLVTDRLLDEGSPVSPELSPLRIVDTQPPRVVIRLPRRVADRLQMEQRIWVVVGDQPIECQVDYRSVEEISAGSKTVWLTIQSDLEQIPWAFGQTVEVRFNLASEQAGCWVPLSALNRDASGLWSVYVATSNQDGEEINETRGIIQRKLVRLYQLQNEWALIDGSLQDEERIVVEGTHRVVSGQQVNVLDVTTQLIRPGEEASGE